MHAQLHLVGVRGHQRLVLRRPQTSPVMRRLAAHVLRVRGYQPYPDLLAVAAEALHEVSGASTPEAMDAARALVIRMPRHTEFAGRTETTVGEVADHLQLAGFLVGRDERLALFVASHAGRA